jgi:integral membrane sensor domain MASE1
MRAMRAGPGGRVLTGICARKGGQMAGAEAPIRVQGLFAFAGLVAGYGASVLFSIFISRMGGQISSIWTATGFLTGALILLTGRWRLMAVALCLAFQAAVSLAVGDGVGSALLGPAVTLLEAAFAAWLAVTYCGAGGRRLSLRKLALMVLGAIAPAAMLGAVAGAGVNYLLRGQEFIDGWLAWAIPSGLGMTMVTPALLLIAREGQYKAFRRSPLEVGGLLGGLCGLTAAAFYQSELPLQFVIFPALTLVAFRLGPPGAAVAGFFVAVICLSLATLGHGPAALAPGLDPLGRVRLTQVVVTAALCSTLAIATAVAENARLRQLLVNRDQAVRLGLRRARAAERSLAESAGRRVGAPSRKGARVG